LAPVLCCCFCLFSLNGGVASAEWSFPLLWLGDVEVAHLPKASASMGVILALSVAFTLLAGSAPKLSPPSLLNQPIEFVGLMSTLTLSLMSADKMTLQRLINSDTCALRKRGLSHSLSSQAPGCDGGWFGSSGACDGGHQKAAPARLHSLPSRCCFGGSSAHPALLVNPFSLHWECSSLSHPEPTSLLGPLPALIISVIEILIFGEWISLPSSLHLLLFRSYLLLLFTGLCHRPLPPATVS